jgi:hypothetical protein
MKRARRSRLTLDAWRAFPQPARDRRADADAVLRVARERHISIEAAARERAVDPDTVYFWFPEAIEAGSATPRDRYLRVRTFISKGRRIFPPLYDSDEAGRAQEANAIQWRYVHNRATEAELARLRGWQIGGYPVESDPAVLLDVARRGEFEPADVYRELV